MNHTKLLQSALEAMRGYRQEHSDAQPCDTERAIEAALAEQAAAEPDYSICPACGGMSADPIVPVEARQQAAEPTDEQIAETARCMGLFSRSRPLGQQWENIYRLVRRVIAERAAAQQVAEPVAWANPNDLQNFDMKVRTNGGPLHTVPLYTHPAPAQQDGTNGVVALQERLRQKPVALQPLTDEQIGEIGRNHEKFDKAGNEWFDRWAFARAIEAAHALPIQKGGEA